MCRALFALACVIASAALAAPPAAAPALLVPYELRTPDDVARAIREHYTKHELHIPMRDGVRLFSHAYVPKDASRPYAFVMVRTPYGVAPYGVDNYPTAKDERPLRTFAPAPELIRHGFIFVQQDVRGRMMSEGSFVDVRPYVHNKTGTQFDESSDTWDTIDWLVKHIPNNNGRAGLWGISYPGFYAAMGAIDAHPALKAVSPQAPVTEWFLGDDFHHNGALCLADAVLFYGNFGPPRPEPTWKWPPHFGTETGDVYDFFLRLGPLSNVNARYFKGNIAFWNDLIAHPDRDAFWQARDPRPHLKNVKPAVLTVGGWYDAEDLFGTLETYRAIEKQSPGASNTLVMGPWKHGGWLRTEGDFLGDVRFGAKTSLFYQERVITPFFLRHLYGSKQPAAPEIWSYETGTNVWRTYDVWPPPQAKPLVLRLHDGGRLDPAIPAEPSRASWTSDPSKPVPYRDRHSNDREAEYMIEDQRFAARRPDVLVYETEPLPADVTIAGPIEAEVWLETTGTDADVVVKLVDVYPEHTADPDPNPRGVRMGGYQQLVRGELMRGRYRNSFERPEPFVANQPTRVRFTLPDAHHTFRTGHRVMVQVQSSWFPLFDRNPQKYVDVYSAKESDFRMAAHTVMHSKAHPSAVTLSVLGPWPLSTSRP